MLSNLQWLGINWASLKGILLGTWDLWHQWPVVLRDGGVLTGEEPWDLERIELTKMARDSQVTRKSFDVG